MYAVHDVPVTTISRDFVVARDQCSYFLCYAAHYARWLSTSVLLVCNPYPLAFSQSPTISAAKVATNAPRFVSIMHHSYYILLACRTCLCPLMTTMLQEFIHNYKLLSSMSHISAGFGRDCDSACPPDW